MVYFVGVAEENAHRIVSDMLTISALVIPLIFHQNWTNLCGYNSVLYTNQCHVYIFLYLTTAVLPLSKEVSKFFSWILAMFHIMVKNIKSIVFISLKELELYLTKCHK